MKRQVQQNFEQRLRGGLERHSDQLLCLSLLVLIVIPSAPGLRTDSQVNPGTSDLHSGGPGNRCRREDEAAGLAARRAAVCGFAAGDSGRGPTSNPSLLALEWTALAAFFLLIVAALFSYLQRVHQIANRHLYTAASIYLLLGLLWFALYNIIEVLFPGSFLESGSHLTHRRSGLMVLQSRDADDGGIWRHRGRCRVGTHPRGAGSRRGRPLRRNHGRVARQCA